MSWSLKIERCDSNNSDTDQWIMKTFVQLLVWENWKWLIILLLTIYEFLKACVFCIITIPPRPPHHPSNFHEKNVSAGVTSWQIEILIKRNAYIWSIGIRPETPVMMYS